ncbi:YkgJ family cysteine cluster protein [Candidatus Woesearchaeota archaeon]|nr:YkgJ family cysteine cluster protein [Candidatus Woesearchaeota archaeon]
MKNNYFAKFIRFLTSFLPIAKNRTGKCVQCGACCKLPSPCLFLKEKGTAHCTVYKFRPLNCRKYPRTEKEFLTKDTCGFRFIK